MFENFIYVKENALDGEICDELIRDFELFISSGVNSEYAKTSHELENRPSSNLMARNDFQLWMPFHLGNNFQVISKCAISAFEEYASAVPSANTVPLETGQCKLQKTTVGGGFHNWHIEQGVGNSASRVLAWMIYLNDVEDGGDTEFLYQGIRLKPKQGTIAIWPAGVTHPHRGNPPYSNNKYVVTGWFNQITDMHYSDLQTFAHK